MSKRQSQQTKWLLKAMEIAFAKGKGLWAYSLLDVLEGLTADQAVQKPKKKDTRSIWEIVQHVTYWKDFLVQRLNGSMTKFSDEESWRLPKELTEDAWVEAVARLKNRHNALIKHLKTQAKLDLNKPFSGTKSPAGEMFFGVLAHDCYHTGQILVLRQLHETNLV